MTLSHIFCVFFFVRWTRPPPPQNFICDFVKPINLSYQSRFFNSTIPRMDPTCVCRRRFFSRLSLSPSFSRRNLSRHASCIIIIITYRLPTPFSKHRFEFSAPRYYDFVSHSKNTKTRAKKDAKTAEMYFESEKPRGTTTTTSRILRAKSIREGGVLLRF